MANNVLRLVNPAKKINQRIVREMCRILHRTRQRIRRDEIRAFILIEVANDDSGERAVIVAGGFANASEALGIIARANHQLMVMLPDNPGKSR